MSAKIPAHVREQQINELPDIRFVRWDAEYRNCDSKAVCQCLTDGFEWASSVSSLLKGHGCPSCAGNRRWTAEERISQINAMPGVFFVRWVQPYRGAKTKAECRCRFGHEWVTAIDYLLNGGTGCPKCAHSRTYTPEERKLQIDGLKGINFIKWADNYTNNLSKAVCRCDAGHEWSASVNSLVNKGRGCPQCAESGYSTAKPGTLYVLRSECGAMVKIGISNDYQTRHTTLKRKTPFDWHCVELLHGDGGVISALEKKLHGLTEPVAFTEKFDGFTEWRKWDNRLPSWIAQCREKIEAP